MVFVIIFIDLWKKTPLRFLFKKIDETVGLVFFLPIICNILISLRVSKLTGARKWEVKIFFCILLFDWGGETEPPPRT